MMVHSDVSHSTASSAFVGLKKLTMVPGDTILILCSLELFPDEPVEVLTHFPLHWDRCMFASALPFLTISLLILCLL